MLGMGEWKGLHGIRREEWGWAQEKGLGGFHGQKGGEWASSIGNSQRELEGQGHVQDAGVELGGQGHVGLGLAVAEEQRLPDEVGIKALGDQVALALLEGGRGLQRVLGGTGIQG